MILHIPHYVKPLEMRSSLIWFDKDGVLYSVPKENAGPIPAVEEIKLEMEKFREFVGHKKVCMILESRCDGTSPSKEQRDCIAAEISSVAKAVALVISSPLSRMAANLFFSFKPPGYPYRMFSNERDAKAWIKQYL